MLFKFQASVIYGPALGSAYMEQTVEESPHFTYFCAFCHGKKELINF